MSNKIDYGVQSYCFRHFKDNAEVAQKVRAIGLNKIELCGVHADFAKPEEFKQVVKTYADAGVSVVSLGVNTLNGEPGERDIFACAASAGAKFITVHFRVDTFPYAIKQAQKWSDEFGVKVAVHCHGGYMFGGQPDVMDYFIKLGAPQIGVCIDTAWCIQIGPHNGKPVEWAKRYAGHLYGIHFKDFVFDRTGQWQDVIVGEGNLDLPAFVTALNEGGFDGMSVIEYEADIENPVPALTRCVAAMRKTIG
ncbi:MAG: sugar phosphate isomerase/epimerase [Verrucomicrobiales bacterium]|jgi:sugar phosphate isomerase/epimerase|nr:sugar phosphate isomerase/epimerase [Verrucomicrobiales bacterium]